MHFGTFGTRLGVTLGDMLATLVAKGCKNGVSEMKCKNGCPKEFRGAAGKGRSRGGSPLIIVITIPRTTAIARG